jgi:ATP-dependent Clp protease protease subunit
MTTQVVATLHDYEARILSLLGTITELDVNHLVDALLRLDQESNKEITIYVSSRGGDILEGLKLIDAIRLMRSRVVCVALGLTEGAGVLLLTASSKRIMFPSAVVTTAGLWELPHQHRETRQPIGLHGEVDARQILISKIKKQVEQIIAEMPRKIPSFLADPTQPPRLFSAEESIEAGIADAIVTGAERQLIKPPPKVEIYATHSTHHL